MAAGAGWQLSFSEFSRFQNIRAEVFVTGDFIPIPLLGDADGVGSYFTFERDDLSGGLGVVLVEFVLAHAPVFAIDVEIPRVLFVNHSKHITGITIDLRCPDFWCKLCAGIEQLHWQTPQVKKVVTDHQAAFLVFVATQDYARFARDFVGFLAAHIDAHE